MRLRHLVGGPFGCQYILTEAPAALPIQPQVIARGSKLDSNSRMDALSEILRVVNLQGAVFFHARCTAPWLVRSPNASTLAKALSSNPGHLVLYHFVAEGRCSVSFDGMQPIELVAGDVILIPHGDSHSMSSTDLGDPASSLSMDNVLRDLPQVLDIGGGGEAARFVCGFMACDPVLFRPILDALPRAISVSLRGSGGTHWLERSIADAVEEANSPKPGGETVLAKLSELMVVETLRRYIGEIAADQQNWLGGLRDRTVGRCLALMHERPANPWTVDSLATSVGVARSVLAERFTHFVGQPPMQYLGKWRMALAANHLSRTSLSLARIAEQVGYETDAAFNRAFKRAYGVPPGIWRRSRGTGMPTEDEDRPEIH
jgi:AraC-like DNA-binding protein